MDYHSESIDTILRNTNSSYKGLTTQLIKSNREKYGSNILHSKKKISVFLLILLQFKEPMNIILIIAAVFGFVSSALGLDEEGSRISIEGIVILVIIFFNIVVTVIQDLKTTSALDSLKKMAAPTCRVIRNGVQDQIPSTELVVGDIVYLDDGCVVPADVRLFDSAALYVNESSLTGESLAVSKDSDLILKPKTSLADRKNMAYSSTIVTRGKSHGIVVNVGLNSEIGKIAEMLDEAEDDEIPLKRKLNSVCKWLTIVGAIIAFLIIVIQVLNNVIGGDWWLSGWQQMVFLAISLAVSIIPEGLPAASTIVLAFGVQKMAKEHALVKQLASVETLGSVNVICSDKTGTLTQNKMIIEKLYAGSKLLNPKDYKKYQELMMCGIYCNNAYIEEDGTILGDPTEGAFLAFGEKYCNGWKNLRHEHRKIDEIPFDSIRKCMTTIHNVNKKDVAYIKGSVEMLIKNCSKIVENNKLRTITSKDKEDILKIANQLANDSFRTLGLARNDTVTSNLEACEKNMIWLGLVAMYDPPREEVKDTIKICHDAGIRVVMITGDHPSTAKSIATYLGICEKNDLVLTGSEIEHLSKEQLKQKVLTCNVFARVSPNDKINIVSALKDNEYIVSMTGDGVNDSPSLKMADVGVAMGITGTDVAKDAADMILLDDDFNTIEVAVREGRRIYSNIQKVISFLVSGNVAEIFLLLFSSVFKFYFTPLPLTAILILFINLLTDTIPSIALGLDVASPNIMKYKPIGKKDFLNKKSILQILYYGTILALLSLLAYIIGKECFHITDHNKIITISFVTLAISEMSIIFCYKSSSMSIFNKKLKYNPWIIYSIILSLVMIVAMVNIPLLNSIFSLTMINWYLWILCIAIGVIPIFIAEITKLIIKLKHNS